QSLVPTYLEHSLATFAREQENLSRQMNKAIGAQALNVMEDQVRRNMDMFERSMRMFMPFAGEGTAAGNEKPAAAPAETHSDAHLAKDVAALRRELASMQAKVEALSADKAPVELPRPPAETIDDGEEDDGFVIDTVHNGKA
ncbi:MAG: hypothetical protein AAFW98_08890, partial [Pseudomonadota bacterium]